MKHPERHLATERDGTLLRLRPVVASIGTVEAAAIVEAGATAIDDARGVEIVEFDLGAVGYVNSAGLGALIDLRNRAAGRGATVRATRLDASLRELFDLMHLRRLFEIE